MVGDTEILAVPLGTLARPGSTFDDPATFRPLAEAQPGGSDPVARLADMDAEGIDQAVLYPTIGLYFSAVADPAAAVALARAYNDWLAGYCAADPRRLFGAAMLPLQDPAAAAARAAPGRRPSSASWPASSGPTRASVARSPTAPTSRCGTRPRSSMCRSASTRAARSSCRRSAPTGPSTRSSSTRCRTPSRRCWPARSSSPSGCSSATRGCGCVFLESSGGWAPVLARAAGRAGRVVRRLLPRHRAAPVGVLRPPVRHQLRGRRAHAARAGARSSAPSASSGAATTPTTTPPSPARSTPSAPPWRRARPPPRPGCSGSTRGGSTACPPRLDGLGGHARRLLRRRHRARRRPAARRSSRPTPSFDVDGDVRQRARRHPRVLHRAHVHLRRLPARHRGHCTSTARR